MKYQNPVITGFYPDPSICRSGDQYYLVCSSFQFFPGVPLFESSDLVNWKQIGHVLTRNSQLPLDGAGSVGGIYAPTIRCHNGRFYMVTTNVTHGGNFYVYTDDIRGEWSEPIYVDQDGIDPSLYFEGDRAYFMSNGTDDNGVHGITQCEIDIATGKKLTPSRSIWQGTGGRFLESPHLYKINGSYYLMASEGGTEYGHMVTYAKGETPYGPFVSYARNPVLTNRNMGGYLLQGCGHADLVDDPNGNWWMVHLCFRQIDQWLMHHITGREVSLVPVTFDADGWFTAGVEGTARLEMETDRIAETVLQKRWDTMTFANTEVGMEWCYMQNPLPAQYRIRPEGFSLCGTETALHMDTASPTFLGIRQKEMRFTASCEMSIAPQEAGMTMYMTPTQHYEVFVRANDEGYEVVRRAHLGTLVHEAPVVHLPANAESIRLTIKGDCCSYHFYAECSGNTYDLGWLETKYLSTEVANNFTGVMLGLYAVRQQNQPAAWTDFTDFVCTNESA